jgi:hypothetical protein
LRDCGRDQGWFESKPLLSSQFTMNRDASLSKKPWFRLQPALEILKRAHFSTPQWSVTVDLVI